MSTYYTITTYPYSTHDALSIPYNQDEIFCETFKIHTSTFTPKVIGQQSGESEYVAKIFLPNFSKSDIHVSVDPETENILIVCATKIGTKFTNRIESVTGNYDMMRASCFFSEEILTIKIPAKEKAKPRTIPVR
jgi:HSP20 family molecular chaperone IbpA